MMGVADNFTPDKTYGTFTLDAKLYEGEKLVDQSSVTYDCENLDPSLCPVESAGFFGSENVITSVFGALLALLAIGGLIYIMQLQWRGQTVERPSL